MAHYDTCIAPICKKLGGDGWYPDEEVCLSQPFADYQKTQRKIQKLYFEGKLDAATYYTKAMLATMQRARQPKGLKPSDGPMPEVHSDAKNSDLSAIAVMSGSKKVLGLV